MAQLIMEPQGIYFVAYGHRFTGRKRNMEMSSCLLPCPSKDWGDMSVLPVTSPGVMTQPLSPRSLPLLTRIWKYPSSRTWMWAPTAWEEPSTQVAASTKATKSQSCHWAQPGAQCSLCSRWHDNSCGSTSQPSWDLDTNPSSCNEECCLSVYSSSENKKTSWQNSFFNVFCHMPTKEGQTLLHAWPRTGLSLSYLPVRRAQLLPFISLLPCRRSPRCELFETRWFRTRLPTLCCHHCASQKELLVKAHLVLPVCQEEGRCEGWLRGDCHCGSFTALPSGSTVPEAEGRQGCWELSVGFIWHTLLSVSEKVFLKITRTTEHCSSYRCQSRNLPERKVGLFQSSIHQAKVEKKENEKDLWFSGYKNLFYLPVCTI